MIGDWTTGAILLGLFTVLLAIGVPVSYCIGLSAVAALLASIDAGPALTTVAQRMATGLDSFALLAIPFFILAGNLMNSGGVARRLVDFAKACFAFLPGGLACVHILAAMLFGAISGSASAAASAIGGVMGPRMEQDGYDRPFCAAVNVTSSTTGLIIPPSNIMIVYSLASGGVSIAALFVAGYLPGIVLGVMLMVFSGVMAVRRGYKGEGRPDVRLAARKFLSALPSLLLIVVVIGGIITGMFTATEAAAVAVLYAFVLAVVVYRELKPRDLPGILLQSCKTTGMVLLLVATSMAMAWALAYADIPQAFSRALLGLSDSPIVILLLINVTLLVVGMFMDMTPAVLIFTPIFLPAVKKLGIDPLHFGMIMILNLCIGLCTPPVGSVLFVGCGIARVSLRQIIRPLLPLFAAMILTLALVTYWPALTLWLPRALGL